jgi:hypothetical protein
MPVCVETIAVPPADSTANRDSQIADLLAGAEAHQAPLLFFWQFSGKACSGFAKPA